MNEKPEKAHKMNDMPVIFEAIKGPEGVCLALTVVDGCSTRVSGPKPWGGGSVIHRWEVKPSILRELLSKSLYNE